MGLESDGKIPAPPSERANWALAALIAVLGAGTLAAVLTGLVGSRRLTPPPLPVKAIVPSPAQSTVDPSTGKRVYASDTSPASRHAAIVARPPSKSGSTAAGTHDPGRTSAGDGGGATDGVQDVLGDVVPTSWMEGFYPIYEAAQHAFGVNWLLIASIHAQETAFSTAPGTYHGLNYAHCCGGPMQFNVTDGVGGSSTWTMVADSYRYAPRPARYDHRTAHHPSIYDDFDSIMAAAHLLELDGASYTLDDSAWWAAYDYYGHDAFGVTYADQVLARAIGWSQHGFCANCGVSSSLVNAVQAAYGAPVDAQIEAEEAAAARREATDAKRKARRQELARRLRHQLARDPVARGGGAAKQPSR